MELKQVEEIKKCHENVLYFCQQYIYLNGTKKFVPYDYQQRLLEHLEDFDLTAFSKFPLGGFTQTLLSYSLWKCLFYEDQKVVWYVQNRKIAIDMMEILNAMIKKIPRWLVGSTSGIRKLSEKDFKDTNSRISFYWDCSFMNADIIIIDDAAFIKNLSVIFPEIFSKLLPNGKCILCSTLNEIDDWFYNFLDEAKKELNGFFVFRSQYYENPNYNKNWERSTKSVIGANAFEMKYEQNPYLNIQKNKNKIKSLYER